MPFLQCVRLLAQVFALLLGGAPRRRSASRSPARSHPRRSSPTTRDSAAAARLWQVSAALVGLAAAG